MNTLNLYELYNLCVWCVYVCMYAGLFWLSICLWLNQNQISWLEQKNKRLTMPWPGYVMLFNPLTHFYQFQKVDSFVDGWKKLLWILRDSFSKFVLCICSFENGRSHLRQMFYAIWSLILKIRAYQQVLVAGFLWLFLIPFLLKSSRGWLEKEREECADMCSRCYPVVWLV